MTTALLTRSNNKSALTAVESARAKVADIRVKIIDLQSALDDALAALTEALALGDEEPSTTTAASTGRDRAAFRMPSPDDDDHDDEFGGTTSSAAADAPDNVGSIALFPATPRPGPHSGRAVSSQPHPALHLRFAGNRRPDKIVRLEENPRDDVPDQEVLFARSMLVTNRKKLYVSSYYGAESEDGRLLAIVGWGWGSDGVTYNSRNRLNSIGSECKFCHGQNNCWGFQCPSAGRMLRRR